MAFSRKVVGTNWYVHVSQISELPEQCQTLLESARRAASSFDLSDYNVLKFHESNTRLTFLSYPDFFEDAFPILHSFLLVDTSAQAVRYRDLKDSPNPPLLHRKELLLDSKHPKAEEFAALTLLAEEIGLFKEPSRIGLKLSWDRLVNSCGYSVVGHQLLPIGNDESTCADSAEPIATDTISRHKTALVRSVLSAPLQALIRLGLLSSEASFFDYGCGRGSDIREVSLIGNLASGWDPYFAPNNERKPATVVNLGFVINVIEDPVERAEALVGAYALTEGVLAVSCMLHPGAGVRGTEFMDGYRTGRNTFQKYFSQSELSQYIEATIGETPHPVGPGIFLVFKDPELERSFMYRGRRRPQPLQKTRIPREPKTSVPKIKLLRQTHAEKRQSRYESLRDLLDPIADLMVVLGRIPDPSETPNLPELLAEFDTFKQGIQFIWSVRADIHSEVTRTSETVRDSLLVMSSKSIVLGLKRKAETNPKIALDVKTFFGSSQSLMRQAEHLLAQISDPASVYDACARAAEKGLGYLDEEDQYAVSTELLNHLPALIRAYLLCGSLIVGEPELFDVVKVHVRTGKLSLMTYDDFHGSAVPRLQLRVKINLKSQSADYFYYGEKYPPPPLFWKSRLIGEGSNNYEAQMAVESQLESMKLLPEFGAGLSPEDFDLALAKERYEFKGLNLIRSTRIASLDDPCGRYLTFRHLIECGETWSRLQPDNRPLQAATYNALADLCLAILDPTIEYFGMIRLTYGFASQKLTKHIKSRIAPRLDQHASCELNSKGAPVCDRLGAAVDFIVDDENMFAVANWIIDNLPFDRIYAYGPDRPIHISHSRTPENAIFLMQLSPLGRLVPKKVRHFPQ